MNYCRWIIFLLFLGASSGFGQNVDSLWGISQTSSYPDTTRLQALKDIIIQKKYYATHLDSSLLLAGHMLRLAEEKELPIWEADAYHLQGLSFQFHQQYESAIQYHKKSLEIKQKLNRKKGIANTSNNIAVAYKILRNFHLALEYNFQALEVRKEMNDAKGIAASLQNISTVYYNDKKYEEALSYALQGYELGEKIGNESRQANSAVSAANAYGDMGQFREALNYYKSALELYQKLGNERNQAICYDNIGNVYVKQKEFSKALEYQEKALAIRMKSNNKRDLTLSYINLGMALQKSGNGPKSLDYCKKGLEYAEDVEDPLLISNACECLADVFEASGDFSQALRFFQRHSVLQDSIDAIEKSQKLKEVESIYELREKEAQLAQQELELSEERYARTRIISTALIAVGLLLAIFAILRNRLRRRRQEAELAAELERNEASKLRELDQLKSNFFANISHEFRTPLTLIMSPLEQMLAGKLVGDEGKYRRIMHRNGKRLQELINQLLDLSKLESGHLTLHLQEGRLSQFLRATALSFGSLADRKQIQYQVLGPDKDVLAPFDKDLLEKILMNLISNAFKYTQDEGKILVAFHLEKDLLSITVEDSGIGIPDAELDNIFDRFYSHATHSDVQMSSGIGLALTKELVDLHQGSISVESEESVGSQFKVLLPISIIQEKSEDISTSPLPHIQTYTPDKSASTTSDSLWKTDTKLPQILLVEDNEDVRAYLKEQLAPNYRVAEAAHGKEGLEIAKELQPALIVSDVMMPEMDGNELCRRLKTDPLTSHIPVILLTAKADQSDKLEGLETGADAYLTKPFDHSELLLRIRNLITQRRQLREKFRSDFRFAPSELQLNSLDAEFLERIRSLIEANMEDETFSVVELSQEIGMSRSNLFRKLKALTNQSPNQVIREMRLIRARELLEKGAGNSTEVSYMVGFNSPSYFSKCFRDFFGKSPSEV